MISRYEIYVAIPEALAEFESPNGTVTVLRSSPRGGLYGELPHGAHRVNVLERFLHD